MSSIQVTKLPCRLHFRLTKRDVDLFEDFPTWDDLSAFTIRDWIGPVIESDLKRILAAGCHDSEAMNLLRRIAGESAPDPDFG